MMDHSRFVIGCLLLIIPVVKSNHSPVRSLIASNVTLEWTEVQDIYNQPEYINTSILWYQIKGSHEDYYMLLRPNGELVPNKALGLYNGSHQVLLLDASKQRVGFVIYAVRQDDEAKYKLRENRTIELLVYAVSDLRVTVETLNVTESIELENGSPLNLHTEQTNLTITLNLEKTAPESAKVTSTRIFENGSRETTNLQCTQGGGRWMNRICPVQMNLSRGNYDTTELTLDYLVEGTEPIILMVVTTPAVESVITTGKQVAIGVSVTVSLAVIAVIIGVILYRKKKNKGRHETLEVQVSLVWNAVLEEAREFPPTVKMPPESSEQVENDLQKIVVLKKKLYDTKEEFVRHNHGKRSSNGDMELGDNVGSIIDKLDEMTKKLDAYREPIMYAEQLMTLVGTRDTNSFFDKKARREELQKMNGMVLDSCKDLTEKELEFPRFMIETQEAADKWIGELSAQIVQEEASKEEVNEHDAYKPAGIGKPSDTALSQTTTSLPVDKSQYSEDDSQEGTKNGANKRVTELAGYVVPLDERDCPEHTFLVRFTKDKLIAKDYPVIGKITNALLNAMGGILILKSIDTLTKSERNSWHQRCTDYMQGLMPEKIATSIHYKPSPLGMIMFIPKSKDLMLYNGGIITRSKTGNEHNLGYDCLVDIVNMKSNDCQPKQINDIYYVDDDFFDDEFLHAESQNREYKHWEVTSFQDIINHISPGSNTKHQEAAKTFSQTLLAMANEPCGGEVIIGIAKTQTQKLQIKGLHLEGRKRDFEDLIDEVLKKDPVTGEPRVWREPGRFPEKNTHWRVTYHDVINTPGNERRVITRIQIDHYPGGVFEVEPAAYDIDQDGYVTQKPFAEWRERMEKISVTTSSRPNAGSIPEAGLKNKNQETPDSVDRVNDGTPNVKAVDPEAMNAALMNRKELSFTKDRIKWDETLEETEVKNISLMEKYITSDFVLDNPLKFTPPKKTVLQRHPTSDVKIEEIEKYHRPNKGFVICVRSWMSYLMEKTIPEGHLTDLLVFVQREDNKGSNVHELHLWVICEQKDDWRYAIHTSLSLKRQLIEGGCPGISVICHTLYGDNKIHSSGHQEEILKYLYSKSEETVDSVKKTLTQILFQKDLHFTTRVGIPVLIKLTEQQADTLFMGDYSRITFIRGPPGSGKTILAMCIAKRYDDSNKVRFVCTTKSFQKYILCSMKCESYLMKSGGVKELKKWIESVVQIKNIKCLIFDDVHNLECTREDWYTILEQLVQSRKNIHLFADPDIQAYKETNSVKDLKDAFHQIEEKYDIIVFQRQLTEVHRNTRKVTAFIKDAVSASASRGVIQIKAAHTLDGDDIEMMSKGGLHLKGADNDLVVLIQKLTLVYPSHDIAVLLGGEKAVEDKIFYTGVLSQHLECKVHGADHHPPEGVQVDIVDEYLGLDAPVVIHLNSKPTPDTQIDNPQYRSFIASRGIFRVIFLVEDSLTHQDYNRMNLDKPLTEKPEAASTEDGKSTNKQAVDDLIDAAEAGDINRVSALLKQGADINGVDHYHYTALGWAAERGELEAVKLLLSQGADTERGWYKPLSLAARNGHIDTVQCLLQHGADINGKDSFGCTALGRAAYSGQLETVKLLLPLGADTERGSEKPLPQAAGQGHIDTVQCLLQHGADINAEDHGATALGRAAESGKLDVVNLLLSLGADIEGGSMKPLSLAAGHGYIDTVQCLLQHGADINGEDSDGHTALGEAAERGELEVVKLLLSQGADTERGRWRKPLSQAAHCGYIDTVRCLLQHGASQEAKNQALTVALNPPSWSTDREKANLKPIVEILRSHGAVADREQEKQEEEEEEEEPPSTSKDSSSTA